MARSTAAESAAPAGAAASPGPAAPGAHVERTLAYEHTVVIELASQVLDARTREVQAACRSRAELGCTLLEVTLDRQAEIPNARLIMRVAPGQADPIIDIAARGGRLVTRTIHAEDLSQPMADTARQLALLTLHRDRLTEFLKRPDLKIDQVIALSREISTAQADIETMTATRANLQRRVDTERLTLELNPPQSAYRDRHNPVREAWLAFGDDFSSTFGVLIHAFAMLLPLGLVTALGGGLWWLVRRRWPPGT